MDMKQTSVPDMKRITMWAGLATGTFVALALFAGKDDIRRFHRMRSM
jgi:hypothetical protein